MINLHHISEEQVVPKSTINVYQIHCLDAQLMKNKTMCRMFISELTSHT
jgi:hypothetical protein